MLAKEVPMFLQLPFRQAQGPGLPNNYGPLQTAIEYV